MAASAKKKPQKKRAAPARKAASTRTAKAETDRRRKEMYGVLFISAGILLGIYLFASGANWLGNWLSHFLFGFIGAVAYALPVILIGVGMLSIKGSKSTLMHDSGWFVVIGVLSIVTLFQLLHDAPYDGVRYMDYVNAARESGVNAHAGGGLTGAVLCFPLLLVGGKALSYILSIALILISVIAVTGLSIKKLSETVSGAAHSAAERARTEREQTRQTAAEERRLYTRSLTDKVDKLAAKVSGESESETPPFEDELTVKRKRKKARSVSEALDDALSFMPAEGELKKKPIKPVVSDAWDDLEPGDDVPLVITPVRGAARVRPRPPIVDNPPTPIDTEKLFGAQPEAQPRRKAARVTEFVPPETVSPEETDAYVPPSFSLLDAPRASYSKNAESPNEKARLLIDALASFGVAAKVVNISVGPVLTRFELQPAPGVRVSRITTLSNDIALALAAPRVRIEAPIPGKAAVGIEIPNKDAVTVVLRDIVESREFMNATSPITLAFGKDISGKVITADLGKMPHLLIAGSTGSGKSVCINDIIISMIYKSAPSDLRLILIDPKMVELTSFGTLPHLLIPVVTEPKKAAGALHWAVNEMTKRYKLFSETGARELSRYNDLQHEPDAKLPKIVVIIDELADLMMVAPDDVEDCICRIAQLGRASGIHLIVATQRPSADVITGLIKANIPSRCAFMVASGIDSRIILDATGAEKLLGRGDMLFHPNGATKPTRLQCAFVSDEEVERIVDYFKVRQRQPAFDAAAAEEIANPAVGGAVGGVFGEGKQEDELLSEAVRVVLENGQASISMIQRRLRVGYARAARLIDMMEQAGYVSEGEGSKPRRVLIKRSQYAEIFGETLPEPEPKEKQS